MIARYAVLAFAMSWIAGVSARAQDHLVPEEGALYARDYEWDYTKTLREVLLKGASRYYLARMVCLPAFEPEWVVTVVREDRADANVPRQYFVEYAGAEEMLSDLKDVRDAKVKRSRAPLDAETAESLNKAWRRMLRATRYPEKTRLGPDGVDNHFSRFLGVFDQGHADPLAGWEQGKIWAPDEDSACGKLVAIGEALKAHALARPEDRDKSRAEIRLKTNQLMSKLDQLASKK